MVLCIRWSVCHVNAHLLLLHPLLQAVLHAEECKGGAESRVEANACRTKFGRCSMRLTLKYHGTYTHAHMHSHTANQAIRSRVRVGIIRSSRAAVYH